MPFSYFNTPQKCFYWLHLTARYFKYIYCILISINKKYTSISKKRIPPKKNAFHADSFNELISTLTQ